MYFLPTRLSTKVTFRSDCRTNAGGHPELDLLGFCLCSAGISTDNFLGHCSWDMVGPSSESQEDCEEVSSWEKTDALEEEADEAIE